MSEGYGRRWLRVQRRGLRYVPFNAAEKNKIEQEIHRAVSTIEKASKKALVRLKCIVLAVSANAR